MSDQKLVCFAHGKESGPWGSKILHLAEVARRLGWATMSPDFSHTRDFDERLAYLESLAPSGERLVLCGSSMGGYVCAHACRTLKPDGLLLLAPALYGPGFDAEPEACPEDTVVVHGWHDDVIPADTAIRFAQSRKAGLHILDDGHRLNNSLDEIGDLLAALLNRCAG